MTKEQSSLTELTRACKEMTRVCKEYSYLWDADEDIWKRRDDDKYPERWVYVASGFIEQDESFSICVGRNRKGNFVFGGRNFGSSCCDDIEEDDYSAEEAAKIIKNNFSTFPTLNADNLRERFYSRLKKPLARYLGKRELEKIKF